MLGRVAIRTVRGAAARHVARKPQPPGAHVARKNLVSKMASELERAAAAFDEEGLSGEVHVVSLKPVLMRLYGANDQRATGMITSALSQGRRHWTRETFLAWWAEEAAREARGKQRGGGSRDAPR